MTNTGPRSGKGKWIVTEDGITRDARAAQLRARNMTYRQISDELGFGDESNTRRAILRHYARLDKQNAETLRSELVAALDEARRRVQEVMDRSHPFVQGGKVVERDGVPLEDDGPTLRAIGELRALVDVQAKLLGAHAPRRVEVTASAAELEGALVELQEELGRARAAGWVPDAPA